MSEKKFSKQAEDILSALTEFAEAVEKGERIDRRFTVRTVELDLRPSSYLADDVKAVRKLLNATQPMFAMIIGTTPATLRSWERGSRPVNAMACRLMDMIKADPKGFIEQLKKAKTPA
jgi:putative transcriptional regulator